MPAIDSRIETITMRRTRQSRRWPSRQWASGYVYDRNGTAVMRHADDQRTTGMRFIPDNRSRCVAMLDAWIEGLVSGDRTEVATAPRTVLAVCDQFMQTMGPTLTKVTHRYFAITIKSYFGDDHGGDCTLHPTTITKRIIDVERARNLASVTITKRRRFLRRIFKWAMNVGYIDTNPVDLVGIPPIPRKDHVAEFSTADVIALCAYSCGRDVGRDERLTVNGRRRDYGRRADHRFARYALLWSFLYLTCARIGEVLAAEWSDIDGDTWHIRGKGNRTRSFPLAAFPEVRELIAAIRREASSYTGKHAHKVFPWFRTPTSPQKHLDDATRALGLKRDHRDAKRTVHTLRASGETRWREELGLSPELISDLAGHSVAIQVKHYRASRTAKQLAAQVARETGREAHRGGYANGNGHARANANAESAAR